MPYTYLGVQELLNRSEAFCPRCGSPNGLLGTSYAYWICKESKTYGGDGDCPPNVYWLPGGLSPSELGLTWRDAVLASPFGREGSGSHFFD